MPFEGGRWPASSHLGPARARWRAGRGGCWETWPMARLFVAVWPTPEVVALLSALDRPALPGGRWSAPEQWLVTLRPLGLVADRVAPPARGGAACPATARAPTSGRPAGPAGR